MYGPCSVRKFYEKRAADPGSFRIIRGDAGPRYRFSRKRDSELWRMAELEGPKPVPFKDMYGEVSSVAMSEREVEEYRRRWEITVEGEIDVEGDYDDMPKPVTTLDGFRFSGNYVKPELVKAGFAEPTPIQAQCWPIALMGRDLIVIAEKGSASGKTLAYLLPAFLHISSAGQQALKVLVLSPTRELALQIQLKATKYGVFPKRNNACIYKGLPKSQVVAELKKGVEVIIATPESLIDLLESEPNIINLRFVTYLVVDDADRMLDMGFESHIQKIYDQVHPDRQTSIWSATWSKELEQLAQRTLIDPFKVIIGSPDLKANHAICQHVYVVSEDEKYKKLVELLEDMKFGCRILIFMDTLVSCLQIVGELQFNFWPTIIIHEDMYQTDREWVLSGSSPGRSWLMIATDVSVRHLDVKDVNYVINYDFPESLEDYLRRIRIAGSVKGAAYTLFTAADARFAKGLVNILKEAGQKVDPMLVSMGRDAPSPMDEEKSKVSMGHDTFAPSPTDEKKPKVSMDAKVAPSPTDNKKPKVSRGHNAFAPSSSSDEQKPRVSMGRDAFAPSLRDEKKPKVSMDAKVAPLPRDKKKPMVSRGHDASSTSDEEIHWDKKKPKVSRGHNVFAPSSSDEEKPKVSIGRDVIALLPRDEKKPKVSMDAKVAPSPTIRRNPRYLVEPRDKKKPKVSRGHDAFAPSSSSDEEKPKVFMGRGGPVIR